MVWADGFRNPFQDSAAIAKGNAFTAQADNPSAIHYNPAGMTQLDGIQHSFGVQLINVDTRFKSSSGVKVDNRIDGGTVGFPPPGQLFITGNLKELDVPIVRNFTVGLGMESLFGFANEYPKDGPFNGAFTRGQLPLLDIKPTMAYRVNEYLSLGLGADIFTFASFLGEGQSENQSIALGNIPGTTAGDELELNGTGTTAGLNLSFLLTPLFHDNGKPFVNLGFVWRSQAILPLKGSLLANGAKVADASTTTRFPESYELGIAVWPIRTNESEWNIEVDVDLVRWSSIREFDVTLSNGTVIRNPQNWSDSVTVWVGTEYRWLAPENHPAWDYSVRTGFGRSHTPIPDQNFNPAFPDSDVTSVGAGVGFFCRGKGKLLWIVQCGDTGDKEMWRKAVSIDLTYMGIFFDSRTVTGSPFPGINGTYKTTTHSSSVTFRIIF